jgi:hypothetical protein
MRSYRRWRDIPVIVVSAATDPELDSAAALGVRRIFAKAHFKLNDFLAAVRELLEEDPPSSAPGGGGVPRPAARPFEKDLPDQQPPNPN